MTYLDANATEPLRPEARAAAIAAMDQTGNPSSIHAAGRAARRILESAREALIRHFGPCTPVFTSGGTEANALAIHALSPGRRVLTGATEHPAILAATPNATRLPVHPDGTLILETLADALRDSPPALVCLMTANNETGVLHPIAEAAALCRAHGAHLHLDAVQSAGRLPPPEDWDSLALSGHKLGGPKGAGALLLRPGLAVPPLIPGGGQERGQRGGTEPLPAIAGLAAALAACFAAPRRLAPLRDALESRLRALAPETIIAGAGAPRLDNTTCLATPGLAAETQLIALDLAGVQVSTGAACSSGKVAQSPVLTAMGWTDLSENAIRISLPWSATDTDIEAFLAAYAAMRARTSRFAA